MLKNKRTEKPFPSRRPWLRAPARGVRKVGQREGAVMSRRCTVTKTAGRSRLSQCSPACSFRHSEGAPGYEVPASPHAKSTGSQPAALCGSPGRLQGVSAAASPAPPCCEGQPVWAARGLLRHRDSGAAGQSAVRDQGRKPTSSAVQSRANGKRF